MAREGPTLPCPTGLSACQARADLLSTHLSSFYREGQSRVKAIVGFTDLRGVVDTQSYRGFNAACFEIAKDWNRSQVYQRGAGLRYNGTTTHASSVSRVRMNQESLSQK